MEDRAMTYSKRDFSKDLEAQLNLGYDPERIGRWAYRMSLEHCREADTELEDIMYELAVMEEGPEFERPESELRELVKLLKGPPEKPPQTERQYQLWKNMIDTIDSYVNNKNQDFLYTLDQLEGEFDASEIKDNNIVRQWYDFWTPLEILEAKEGNEVNKNKALQYLSPMKDFLLKYLGKPHQTERQYQLWKNMVDAIDRYINNVNNETQDFHDVVSKLEAALDPSEFKDIDLISKWYDFWAPLESRRAAEGNEVNKAQAVKELLKMKEFLLGYLDTDRYAGK